MFDQVLKFMILLFLGLQATICLADGLTVSVAELKAKSAQKLSKEELDALVPDSTFRNETESSNRSWTHYKDGTLAAFGQKKPGQGSTYPASAHGKWRVTDDGKLCVEVEWPVIATEKWCLIVSKLEDYYVGVRNDVDDAVKGYKFALKK